MRSLFVALWGSTLLLASAAPAADPPTTPAEIGSTDAARMFAELDANHDGQLVAEEIPADKQGLFARLMRTADENKDGKLSQREFAAGLAPRAAPEAQAPPTQGAPQAMNPPTQARGDSQPNPGQMFRRLDANGDGKLARDEVPEPRRQNFAQMFERGDRDGDGVLSQREFLAAFDEYGPGARGRGAQGASPGQPQQRGGRGYQPPGAAGNQPDPQRMFQRMDANGDGQLTRDEVPQPRRQEFLPMFAQGDIDGDGALNLREFVRAFNQFGPGAQSGQQPAPAARPARGRGALNGPNANRGNRPPAGKN